MHGANDRHDSRAPTAAASIRQGAADPLRTGSGGVGRGRGAAVGGGVEANSRSENVKKNKPKRPDVKVFIAEYIVSVGDRLIDQAERRRAK